METEVKGYYITRRGKRIYVRPHEMHVNERVHERHEKRLGKEIKELEEMAVSYTHLTLPTKRIV